MARNTHSHLPTANSASQALAQAPGLGPKSAALLQAAGIVSMDQLRTLGAVAAYVQVQRTGQKASLNLLWAMEGALSGLHWQHVAREHRTSLLLTLEQLQADGTQ